MRLSLNDIEVAARRAAESLHKRSGSAATFTEADLHAIDAALTEASRYKDALPDDVQDDLVRDFGCLTLEIGRRAHGGRYAWLDESAEPVLIIGEPTRHIAIAAWGTVRGRLDGDAANSVTFLYRGFADQVRSAPAGTQKLFI